MQTHVTAYIQKKKAHVTALEVEVHLSVQEKLIWNARDHKLLPNKNRGAIWCYQLFKTAYIIIICTK